jgi:hypothetical protein
MGGDTVTAAAHRDELAHTIAHVVCDVPGVAFLRPGIIDLLRASARSGPPNPEGSPSGVRLIPRAGAGQWDVDVQIVVQHGHRALDESPSRTQSEREEHLRHSSAHDCSPGSERTQERRA